MFTYLKSDVLEQGLFEKSHETIFFSDCIYIGMDTVLGFIPLLLCCCIVGCIGSSSVTEGYWVETEVLDDDENVLDVPLTIKCDLIKRYHSAGKKMGEWGISAKEERAYVTSYIVSTGESHIENLVIPDAEVVRIDKQKWLVDEHRQWGVVGQDGDAVVYRYDVVLNGTPDGYELFRIYQDDNKWGNLVPFYTIFQFKKVESGQP